MKREEFKLLIENWRKNFIVESPEHDPHGVQHDLDRDDLAFADPKYADPDYQDDLLGDTAAAMDDPMLDTDDMAMLDLPHGADDDYDEGLYSMDSNDEGRGFSGVYDDPTTGEYQDSDEFGDMSMPHMAQDSSYEDSDREIDEAIDEAIDEYTDDEYGF